MGLGRDIDFESLACDDNENKGGVLARALFFAPHHLFTILNNFLPVINTPRARGGVLLATSGQQGKLWA